MFRVSCTVQYACILKLCCYVLLQHSIIKCLLTFITAKQISNFGIVFEFHNMLSMHAGMLTDKFNDNTS